MKLSVIFLVVLGLVAAFAAAMLVTTMNRPAHADSSADAAKVTVLYVTKALPSITLVEADAVEAKTVPVSEAPAGYLSDPVQAVGRVLVRPMVAGQPLTTFCFASPNRGLDLVANMPAGKRAMTVQLTHSRGLDGLLYPGSVVDVIASFKLRKTGGSDETAVSTTLIHGVEVLAIDDKTVGEPEVTPGTAAAGDAAQKKSDKATRVTLLLDTEQAKALQLATEYGAVSLAMRNPLDEVEARPEPMVLSGGQLAGMAEYLESMVNNDANASQTPVFDAPRDEPQHEQAASPLPPPAPSKWNVSIMRPGKADETHTFVQPAALQ